MSLNLADALETWSAELKSGTPADQVISSMASALAERLVQEMRTNSMLPADNLEAFFEKHGHSGATLDDLDVIEDICDAACDLVRGHKSFGSGFFSQVCTDIDPRLPHGRTNLAIVADGLLPTRRL